MPSVPPSKRSGFPNASPDVPESIDVVQQGGAQITKDELSIKPTSSRKVKKDANHWRRFQGQKSDWWFASTGIPLLAATLGPLANISSIAALVTSWRAQVFVDGAFVADFKAVPFADPRWCYWLNVVSLIFGFLGNLFLMFNFTQRIRYIIALPPYQTYTQGFWYAIAAAALYLLLSILLMINMLGFFLGHYPDSFALSEAQRTLILQTMLFFIWLGGGAAVFSKVETDHGDPGWGFVDAMYFCDVTILTVGFGDLYPTTDLGRGLVFPYSVGGIVTLALIVSSIYRFMRDLGEENIVQRHTERMRKSTIDRVVTNSIDLREREQEEDRLMQRRRLKEERPTISAPSQPRALRTAIDGTTNRKPMISLPAPLKRNRKPRLLLLREEKDRFLAMRAIQLKSRKFKKWFALVASVVAFGILWCVGAAVFWQAERGAQGMTYFQALYFCYVSLLTVGYGDLSPKSNAGRVFFVIWSLIAVPTMTILVSDMGDTVVDKFRKWSDELADFTVLPKEGIWRAFLEKHPWLMHRIQKRVTARAERKRLNRGFEMADPDEPEQDAEVDHDSAESDGRLDRELTLSSSLPGFTQQADQDIRAKSPSRALLSHRLAQSIKRVAADLHLPHKKRYDFEDWVEFTNLIRHCHSKPGAKNADDDEDEVSLIEWDWIGENSPLISGLSEARWVLDKLCESLLRLERQEEANAGEEKGKGEGIEKLEMRNRRSDQSSPSAAYDISENSAE